MCLSIRGEVCKTGVCTKYKPEFDYEPTASQTYGCGSIPMRNTDTQASGDGYCIRDPVMDTILEKLPEFEEEEYSKLYQNNRYDTCKLSL